MLASIFASVLMLFSAMDTIITNHKYDSIVFLEEIKIESSERKDYQKNSSQNNVEVNKEYLENHFSGSLSQTLEEVPGVKAMSIGSNQSKPTIRGMGFNRMVVTENGIKHESQQWGDDHGLEIDQFSVDKAEIIKGPAALEYGSDAIGGVLNLYTNYAPIKDFEARFSLLARSNNDQLGLTGKLAGRKDNFFYRIGFSFSDYADYRVPTDSIQYYSYWIKLKDSRLRNTAGKDANFDLMLGYGGHKFHTDIKISNNFSKSGFFADAHGLEVVLSKIDYDKSFRDIDLPFQQVNHFKVLSHSVYSENSFVFESNIAFQNNLREENSEALSHGYMPTPSDNKERQFNKNTYSANLNIKKSFSEKHSLKLGVNSEYQQNKIDGWGFIIPEFSTLSLGTFLTDKWEVNRNLIINGGIRYDWAKTDINSYYDWYLTPTGYGDSVYRQRSEDVSRNFSSFTYSMGANYNYRDWVFKLNIGKSFRIPIAKELGANGVNYHIFRYEKGNRNLKPEESYQMDLGVNFENKKINVEFSPYLNYFPNYIYLNPTADYTEGLQTYCYTQSEVLRYGFEFQVTYFINKYFETEFKTEYLYSEQLSGEKKGYTLPFSTPWNMYYSLKYNFDIKNNGFVSFNIRVVGAQNEIVPPEKPTEGYCVFNLSAGRHFYIKENTFKVTLQVRNLLNTRYYDHISYYRLIDIPEQGRNISLLATWDF